ncbi:hypothetical protein O979_16415 [Mycobacterium avium subsp. paratuberculosis 10-4404]|nr:hypothetical protein O979_16415 [Mycobacterium avium subsp. paratuberculosis 10-4404]ETB02256.1 hypothetical protein O978_16315 [Mycobacterium avium subsp. paratuberculosis 10-5864]ETB28375.1 hypothetical protein O977_20365 [Mycobacterium avium subsp. paratuberculosis 10-5975]ETB49325.1 hypothetical protein O976_16860 [Mycobacterium avium subsp. paratuberculosis 10-8425]
MFIGDVNRFEMQGIINQPTASGSIRIDVINVRVPCCPITSRE